MHRNSGQLHTVFRTAAASTHKSSHDSAVHNTKACHGVSTSQCGRPCNKVSNQHEARNGLRNGMNLTYALDADLHTSDYSVPML